MTNGNDMNSSSSFGPGMEEPRHDLGGSPAGGGMGSVKDMASQAGEKLMNTAEQQKLAGADLVTGIASAVRRAAGELDGQSPQAAHYIRYAADQMESMSDSLRRRDIGQMLSEVQSFARRQPTAFLGVSFLAGFAAMRFLRSSAQGTSGSGSWEGSSHSWRRPEPMDDGRFGAPGNPGMGTGDRPPGAGL